MNRLELVNRLISESGVTNLSLGSTLNQRGEALQFVNWLDDAWLEIQGLMNWPSLWEQATVTIAAGNSLMAQGVQAKRYVKDSAFVGGMQLGYVPWDDFRLAWPSLQAADRPTCWTIRPDRAFVVNAIVQSGVAVQVERFKQPQRFTSDTEVPSLFEEHHMMIVWRALMLYASFDEAGVIYRRGASEYALMKRLAAGDLPEMAAGEPLL